VGASRLAIVTGGAGFVGSYLAPRLLATGSADRVVILDRKAPEVTVPGVEHVGCDIDRAIDWVPDAAVDVVYHLAAACREPGFTPEEYRRDNVLGTEGVVAWMRRHDLRNLVFTSTMMVYGARDERCDETADCRPETDYGRTKQAAEAIVRAWQAEAPGRRLRIVRPAVIFGKHERNNFTKLHRALKRNTFAFIGRDSTVKSCIYVKDFVRFLEVLAHDDGPHDLYNAAYPQPTTIRAVCDAMLAAYGWGRWIPTVPYAPALAAASVLEKLGSRAIHPRRVQKLYFSTHLAADRMAQVGFRPEFGLPEAIADWKRDCGGGELY
jgi:nucleoside-diphosphate-sugar epimerase